MKIVQSQISVYNNQGNKIGFCGKKSLFSSLIKANSEPKRNMVQSYGGVHSNRMNIFEKLLWRVKDLFKKVAK